MKPVEARRNYSGVVGALVRIARDEGFSTLYSGLAPNILRGMSMNMGMMACYDEVSDLQGLDLSCFSHDGFCVCCSAFLRPKR